MVGPNTAVRSVAKLKRVAKTRGLLLALFGGGVLYLCSCNNPPDESKLIDDFHVRRAAYERLRDMLLADQQVRAVYERQGVETSDSGLPRTASEANFPVSRFNEYRALLERARSTEVFRVGGNNSGVCIAVWAAGFGGDTRHVDICWTERRPNNQVSRLTDFYRTPKPRHPVFRHIDSNWYLWTDW
jgi:hypothetical protein